MSNHYNCLMPREYTTKDGATKTAFTKIGVAFPMKNREGFQVTLECIPLQTIKDGKLECKLLLMPPIDEKAHADPLVNEARAKANKEAVESDSIPF